MMDIKCEVIQDLLQLYVDDLCSEESNKLVEQHLESCEECRGFLDTIKEREPLIDNCEVEVDTTIERKLIKNIKKRLLLIELICLSIGAFGGLYTTLFINQFQLIIIYPVIGCAAYLFIKRFWIPPVLIFGVSITGCLIVGRIGESLMLSFVSSFLTLIGCIIAYSFKKIFER